MKCIFTTDCFCFSSAMVCNVATEASYEVQAITACFGEESHQLLLFLRRSSISIGCKVWRSSYGRGLSLVVDQGDHENSVFLDSGEFYWRWMVEWWPSSTTPRWTDPCMHCRWSAGGDKSWVLDLESVMLYDLIMELLLSLSSVLFFSDACEFMWIPRMIVTFWRVFLSLLANHDQL